MAVVGRWYQESAKRVRLYCVSQDAERVYLSYAPNAPIAVTPTREDFATFFEDAEALK